MFEKIISKHPEDQSNSHSSPPSRPSAPEASSSKPASSSPSPGGQRNILSNDVEIKGKVRFENDLLVDGKIEGEIASSGSLTVAENAHIKAEIRTKSVIIYGKVHGNIIATERIEVKNNAELVGDIKAPTLSIEPGAIFVGTSEVGNPSTKGASVSKPGNQSPLPNENSRKSGDDSSKDSSKDSKSHEQKELIGSNRS